LNGTLISSTALADSVSDQQRKAAQQIRLLEIRRGRLLMPQAS
jgi:hypothetical protein